MTSVRETGLRKKCLMSLSTALRISSSVLRWEMRMKGIAFQSALVRSRSRRVNPFRRGLIASQTMAQGGLDWMAASALSPSSHTCTMSSAESQMLVPPCLAAMPSRCSAACSSCSASCPRA